MKVTATQSFFALAGLAKLVSAAWDLNTVNNVAVYWGQNAHGGANPTSPPEKQQQRLVEYCKNTDYDLIFVSFVNSWAHDGNNITINVSNACEGWQYFPGGSGMLWCPTISEDIKACQKTYNKKIIMSIGGGAGDYDAVSTNNAAIRLAQNIWDAFGKGWTYYRPFGDAVVDGFDFDIESGSSKYYNEIASRLRAHMKADEAITKKQWILTASPQCIYPDVMMDNMMTKVSFDAAFIQFYNNEACQASSWVKGRTQVGPTARFNFATWDNWAKTLSKNKNIKLFMTLPMNSTVGRGYVSRVTTQNILNDIKQYSSFAGLAAWDASEADNNVGFISTVKGTLNNIQNAKAAAAAKRDFIPEIAFGATERIEVAKRSFISRLTSKRHH